MVDPETRGDRNSSPRILFTTGHKMVALNARTGRLDPGIGSEGKMTMDAPFAGVPTVYKDVTLAGMNVYGQGEPNLHPQTKCRADCPMTRAPTMLEPEESCGIFTPSRNRARPVMRTGTAPTGKRAGNNMWSCSMTVGEQRGIVYLPVGWPVANYYGSHRKGNNLFANSVVAVDAATGKLKWYFQTVHHELWDYDLPPDPVLVDRGRPGVHRRHRRQPLSRV